MLEPGSERVLTGATGNSSIDFSSEVTVINLRALLGRIQILLREESGQGMVEYALILVLIAVVVIVILIVLGNQVQNVFSNISAGLGA